MEKKQQTIIKDLNHPIPVRTFTFRWKVHETTVNQIRTGESCMSSQRSLRLMILQSLEKTHGPTGNCYTDGSVQ